jgi:hypothetical protein
MVRVAKIILTVIPVAFVSFCSLKHPDSLKGKNWVILPGAENEVPGKAGSKGWTPSEKEAMKAEEIARGCLKKDAPRICQNLDRYKRQFVGLIVDGKKAVWINYFHDVDGNIKDWKKELVIVKDGGEDFFEIKVDLESASCFGLYVHGEA